MTALNNVDKTATTHAAGIASTARDGQIAFEQIPTQVDHHMQADTKTACRISSEMLRYAAKRLHFHAAHLQILSVCTTPQSFIEQQMAFMNSSMQDYRQAVSKLIEAAQGRSAVSAKQSSS
jgi:hypothetical protein